MNARGGRRRHHPQARHWSAQDRKEAFEGFRCVNKDCNAFVPVNDFMGTQNRNHCPTCLCSRHVDEVKPGDRKATCKQPMRPVALTFKHEAPDKYGNERIGELMLVHVCEGCAKVSINRIAADDSTDEIEVVFEASEQLDPQLAAALDARGVRVLGDADRNEIDAQLYGRRSD